MKRVEGFVFSSFLFSFFLLLLLLSYQINLNLITGQQKMVVDSLRGDQELIINLTQAELSHLADVKELINKAEVFFVFLILINFFLGFYLHQKKKLFFAIFFSSLLVIIFSLLLLFFVMVDFDFVFNLFHQILFPPGTWIFSEESLLIKIFPEEFFIGLSRKIFITLLLMGIILLFYSYWKDVANRKRN